MKSNEFITGSIIRDPHGIEWQVSETHKGIVTCFRDGDINRFYITSPWAEMCELVFIQSSSIQEDDLTKSLNEIYKECEFDIDYFYKPLPPLMDCRQFNWELIEGEFKSINILDESNCVINGIHYKEIYTWGDDDKNGIYVGDKHSIFITTTLNDHVLTLILVRNNKQIK